VEKQNYARFTGKEGWRIIKGNTSVYIITRMKLEPFKSCYIAYTNFSH